MTLLWITVARYAERALRFLVAGSVIMLVRESENNNLSIVRCYFH
jgi:hypothetical protein